MNILFLYNSNIDPIKGGVQKVTFVLSSYFEDKGNSVFFLSLKKGDNAYIQDERQYYFPSENGYDEQNKIFFLSFLKDKRIDIVVNQDGKNPALSELAYLCHSVNIKLISVIHNSLLAAINNFSVAYNDRFRKYKMGWLLPLADLPFVKIRILWLYKRKYKKHYTELCNNSDYVFLLSEKYKEELLFVTDKKFNNVIGIPNPIDFKRERHCNKEKELLYVGRINFSQKRVDLLLKIWHKLFRQYPDWSLRVVGGGNQLQKAVKMSSDLGLKNIYFEGFRDPEPLYKTASLFCLTSSYEGFGNVLVEAMCYGVVPFAFNSYLSVTDIIDDKKNGILIQPFDVDDYVKKLAFLMENESQRLVYSKAAVEKSKQFTIEKIGNKWLDMFNKLMRETD